MSQGEFFGRCTCVVGSNDCYNFIFLYKDEFDQEAEARFLNSIRIHH
jgi:hypothetical protein